MSLKPLFPSRRKQQAQALTQREQALAQREQALAQREQALAQREQALGQRTVEQMQHSLALLSQARETQPAPAPSPPPSVLSSFYRSIRPLLPPDLWPPADDAAYLAFMDRLFRAADDPLEIVGPLSARATIRGTSGQYTTTLASCSCTDFAVRGGPCKHMLFLALSLGASIHDHLDYQTRLLRLNSSQYAQWRKTHPGPENKNRKESR